MVVAWRTPAGIPDSLSGGDDMKRVGRFHHEDAGSRRGN